MLHEISIKFLFRTHARAMQRIIWANTSDMQGIHQQPAKSISMENVKVFGQMVYYFRFKVKTNFENVQRENDSQKHISLSHLSGLSILFYLIIVFHLLSFITID